MYLGLCKVFFYLHHSLVFLWVSSYTKKSEKNYIKIYKNVILYLFKWGEKISIARGEDSYLSLPFTFPESVKRFRNPQVSMHRVWKQLFQLFHVYCNLLRNNYQPEYFVLPLFSSFRLLKCSRSRWLRL